MSISVVIINFNGLMLMKEHLPSIVEAMRKDDDDIEFIVVDNASGDGSPEWLAQTFPEIRLLLQDQNLFFAPAANLGIASAKNNLVLLLNPDVHAVEPNLREVYARFAADEHLFALSPCLIDPRDNTQEMLYAYSLSRGTVDLLPPLRFSPDKERMIPYGTGGALFLRRDVFLSLGGFRDIYSPFYWDDPDLGLRAWAAQWKTVYAPASRFHHYHSSLISTWHKTQFVRRIYERNRLLFMYLNLSGLAWRMTYALWLPLRLARSLISDRLFWRGWRDFRRMKRHVPPTWRGRRNAFVKDFPVSRES